MAKLYKLKKFQKQLKKCRVSQRYDFFFYKYSIFNFHSKILLSRSSILFFKTINILPGIFHQGKVKFPVNIRNTYNIWFSFLISWLILSKKKFLNFHLTFRDFCKGNYSQFHLRGFYFLHWLFAEICTIPFFRICDPILSPSWEKDLRSDTFRSFSILSDPILIMYT